MAYYFLLIASIALSIAATLDGFSSVHFLRNPNYEEVGQPMRWLFGPRPTWKQYLFGGGGLIAAEIAAAWVISHYANVGSGPYWIFGASGLVQASVHVYESIRNFKVPV